jgi:hypothetical protein
LISPSLFSPWLPLIVTSKKKKNSNWWRSLYLGTAAVALFSA